MSDRRTQEHKNMLPGPKRLFALMSLCLEAILSNCHFRLLRIAYSGHAGTHGEKKRFSRVCGKPSCHPRRSFCLLPAWRRSARCANRQEARNPQRGFAPHCVILVLTIPGLQREKKRRINALPHNSPCPPAHRRADVFPTSCGEKKCFLSRTKNHSAEICS